MTDKLPLTASAKVSSPAACLHHLKPDHQACTVPSPHICMQHLELGPCPCLCTNTLPSLAPSRPTLPGPLPLYPSWAPPALQSLAPSHSTLPGPLPLYPPWAPPTLPSLAPSHFTLLAHVPPSSSWPLSILPSVPSPARSSSLLGPPPPCPGPTASIFTASPLTPWVGRTGLGSVPHVDTLSRFFNLCLKDTCILVLINSLRCGCCCLCVPMRLPASCAFSMPNSVKHLGWFCGVCGASLMLLPWHLPTGLCQCSWVLTAAVCLCVQMRLTALCSCVLDCCCLCVQMRLTASCPWVLTAAVCADVLSVSADEADSFMFLGLDCCCLCMQMRLTALCSCCPQGLGGRASPSQLLTPSSYMTATGTLR